MPYFTLDDLDEFHAADEKWEAYQREPVPGPWKTEIEGKERAEEFATYLREMGRVVTGLEQAHPAYPLSKWWHVYWRRAA